MDMQEVSPRETGKGAISLGVMLRRVAEGKMTFAAALESPFSTYFCEIEALNILSVEEKKVFIFFLSKIVRLPLPLQSGQVAAGRWVNFSLLIVSLVVLTG